MVWAAQSMLLVMKVISRVRLAFENVLHFGAITPRVSTPTSLAIFCIVHRGISWTI